MKYTADQLRFMALDFLQAAEVGDVRCSALIIRLSRETGMSYEACKGEIRALAGLPA